MRQGITVQVSEGDRVRLAAIIADRNSPQKHVWRARIVLMTADGIGTIAIMRQTGKSKVTVWRWQERFMAQGVDGLLRDKTRPSRIPPLPATVHERTVAVTLTDPPAEVTHWTAEMMAKKVGISVSSVRRIWRTHGLQPHRVRQFKLSRDRQFVAKLRDIVGLGACPRAGRRAGPVGRSAGACGGVVGRREIANPSARPHPTRPADEEGPLRDDDP
jgi:transposase